MTRPVVMVLMILNAICLDQIKERKKDMMRRENSF